MIDMSMQREKVAKELSLWLKLKPYICRLHGPCPYHTIQSVLVLSAAWFERSGRTAATSSICLNSRGNREGYTTMLVWATCGEEF